MRFARYRQVHGQRFSLRVPVRDAGQEHICHPRCGAAFRGRHWEFRERFGRMFVDSVFRFQYPYGTRDKSASAILGVMQRFVADMGVPRAFWTDNGAEYTNSTFVDYCNSLRIRRDMTAPYRPQQKDPVESGLMQAIKAGHAARTEVNKLFSDEHLDSLKGVRDPDGSSLCTESFCGPLRDSTAPQPRRIAACFSHTSYSSGAARRCRFCRSPSRRTIASRGRVPPGAPGLFPEFFIQPQGRLFKGHGHRDRDDRALARRHIAPAAKNANFPGPDS